MKKTNPKFLPSLYAAALVLLITTAAAAGNGSRIGDGLAGDEEFLMESESNRRLLGGAPRYIIPKAIHPKSQPCNARIFDSCNNNPNTKYKKRPKTYKNQSKRY